ncbi:MAG: transposase [Dehalococcoidia bacterium]
MKLLIGLDWSKDHHHVCFMSPNGSQQASFEISHTATGFARLDEERAKFGVPATECLVALETAHNLVVDFLWARRYQVYVIPPSVVKGSRGRYGVSGAYTDASSALLLADLLRTDRARFIPWHPDGTLARQMRAKLSLIEALRKDINRWSNRLLAVLLRVYPHPVGLFSKLTTHICLHFLIAYPTPHAAQALSYQDFVSFCRQHGYPSAKLPTLYAHLQSPRPEPDPVALLAYRDEIPFLARTLLPIVRHRAQLIREVKKLFAQHPDHLVFESLPGAGDLLAPSLLVKFGDHRERFPSAAIPQALAGTCPYTKWSGKKKVVLFRKACDKDFRRIAQQLAIESVKQSVWAATYWQEVYARCHSKSQAYRCLANRWLAIIWKMWQTRKPYDEEYHLKQRLLRRQPRPK